MQGNSGGTGSGGTGSGGTGVSQNLGEDSAAVAWRVHGFDHGGNRYGFEANRSGDRARVVINGRPALELPAVVWNALLGVVQLQRRELKDEVAVTPERVGSAWDTTEDEQLRAGWRAKRTVGDLAVQHRRSRGAITARLRLLGLIEVDPLMAASVAEPLAQH